MALLPLLSFSSGELDPVLTDNVTLEKFKKGLSTARNVLVGKTGSLYSRFPTYSLKPGKLSDRKIRLYIPPNTGSTTDEDYVLEFGHLYLRIYTLTILESSVGAYPLPQMTLAVELSTIIGESDLDYLHLLTSKNFVYIFRGGVPGLFDRSVLKLKLDGGASDFVPDADIYKMLNPLSAISVTAGGSPSGYKVDYAMTLVINGEETLHVETGGSGYSKPIAAGQTNVVSSSWSNSSINFASVSEVRVYSRPNGGGAFGLLGTTNKISTVGANSVVDYVDIGSVPDYTQGLQDLGTKYGFNGIDPIDLEPVTGTIYQQRLVQSVDERIIASRPGYQNNLYRDFPLAADSALVFKAGTSGNANVLRMIESDGLIVFTTNGVYTNGGVLGPTNTALDRRGPWVISEKIPPLVVPGGIFFVDRSNAIRQLIFSQDILAYEAAESSIFSNHLFRERTINSWAFQDGITPVITVTFTDGSWATFTYNYEHQMRAWTRHDTRYPVEQVEGSEKSDRMYFVVNKDGQRHIEMTLPRIVPRPIRERTKEWYLWSSTAFMDSMKTKTGWLNPSFSDTTENFVISPVTPDDWEGVLEVTNTDGFQFNQLAVGDVVRWFHPIDRTFIDMEILTLNGTNDVWTVQPTEEFPSEYATSAELYQTFNVIDGLEHLEGEEVSVIVDGSLVASPLNDHEEYPTITVTGGEIELPDDMLGAIIHVGRPIVADIKTLNISTLEQAPTLIESVNVNKIYIRVNETKGLYLSNDFPEEANGEKDGSTVELMEDLDENLVPPNGILGNTYFKPVSRRIERTIPGSWASQGKVSIRQVDPFHFEILSLIPDVDVERRSDR